MYAYTQSMAQNLTKAVYVPETGVCIWKNAEEWAAKRKMSMSALIVFLLEKELRVNEQEITCRMPHNDHQH